MILMTTTNEHHLQHIAQFSEETPIEIRFHAKWNDNYNYQILGSVGTNGTVHYTLYRNPRGSYSESLTNLSGRDKTHVTLPMKAYKGWQIDVLSWVSSLSNHKGEPIYTVDEVF